MPSCRESAELRLFLEASPLTAGKLRVDEDELGADHLGLQREHGTSGERRLKPVLAGADCTLRMTSHPNPAGPGSELPAKGQRVELLRTKSGVRLRGTVFYADHLQVLVKWDNGQSQSLRLGVDRVRIIE